MSKIAIRSFVKLLAAMVLLIVFIYLIVLINSVPARFSVKYIDGKFFATYPVEQIIETTNERFVLLLKGELDYDNRGKSLKQSLPNYIKGSIVLLISGLLLGVVLGITKGILDSRGGRQKNKSIQLVATIIPISMPDILVIAILQQLAVFLSKNGIKILKVAGSGSFNHVLLPAFALSLLPAFYIARTLAMSIDSCFEKDYVKTALGKGCSRRRVLWNHVMRNAIGIVFESLSNITAQIICNLMLVEYFFSYAGLTTLLMRFYFGVGNTAIIIIAVIIGFIYFILDIVFKLINKITHMQLREETV